MRRRRLLVGLAVALVLMAGAGFAAWPRADRVTKENFDRIRWDMGLAEVEALLGPPGDYRTGPGETDDWMHRGGLVSKMLEWTPDDEEGQTRAGIVGDPGRDDPDGPYMFQAMWVGDTGEASIYFIPDGVLMMSFDARRKMERGPLDQLRWRGGRYWRKWSPR